MAAEQLLKKYLFSLLNLLMQLNLNLHLVLQAISFIMQEYYVKICSQFWSFLVKPNPVVF